MLDEMILRHVWHPFRPDAWAGVQAGLAQGPTLVTLSLEHRSRIMAELWGPIKSRHSNLQTLRSKSASETLPQDREIEVWPISDA
jgi:hypothetical protein